MKIDYNLRGTLAYLASQQSGFAEQSARQIRDRARELLEPHKRTGETAESLEIEVDKDHGTSRVSSQRLSALMLEVGTIHGTPATHYLSKAATG